MIHSRKRLLLALPFLALTAIAFAQEPPRTEVPPPATPRLVMALYRYDFQGDRRKKAAFRFVREADGRTRLAHHPWDSDGPWFSADRSQWHRNQLQLMAGAGIDVALAVFRGDAEERGAYAIKGLDVMVQGLKELRAENVAPLSRPHEYPQVGLALDLGSLARQYGGPVDLKNEDVQRSLYGLIRDFYLHVPAEFRAWVQLSRKHPGLAQDPPAEASAPAGTACVVRLFNDTAVRDADNSFLVTCNRRFAAEFGAQLLWIGTPALAQKADRLDACAADTPATGAESAKGAWLSTGRLSPGYDDLLLASPGRLRARQNGATYVADWRQVHRAAPEWVLLDSWNDYARGTELAPTLEYGLQYQDLTRAAAREFKAAGPHSARVVRATVPRVAQPRIVYPVEVVVQNTGTADWDPLSSIFVSYRWLKGGKPVGDQPAAAIAATLARGDVRTYILGVTAPMKGRQPLPAGDYDLELGLVRRIGLRQAREEWLDAEAAGRHLVPVRVGEAPPLRPYWLSSTAPALVKSGLTYQAEIRLRNDGSRPWAKGTFAVGARWRRVSSYLRGYAEDQDTILAEIPRMLLPAVVPPGREITVPVSLPVANGAGQPLPLWSPNEKWYYVLEWDLWDGARWASQEGGATHRETVTVVDRDPAPRFLGTSLPTELAAGRTVQVTLGLLNTGPESYRADRDRIAIHWFYLDGSEASWMDQTVPLSQDIPAYSRTGVETPVKPAPHRRRGRRPAPPETRTQTAVSPTILRDLPVRVPDYFGPMYCVFDLVHAGEPASIGPASKGGDLLVVPVNVFSPVMMPLPLGAHQSVDGISQDSDRADGNIDGRFNSLPAELLPPYVMRPTVGPGRTPSPMVPCGLWVRPVGAQGDRVTFMFPGKADRTPNIVACNGQRLEFAAAPRIAVHLLGLATEEDAAGDFRLIYADASVDVKPVTMTHFVDTPRHGEHVAFRLSHRHTRDGDDPRTPCNLYHYEIVANRQKPLLAIELPRNPAMKIVAITLENLPLSTHPAP
ncbi:MAG: hypothetical protein HY320_03770 [Armatimonadetes bacterium]|nr:hypothetical protein [Armatimonadota bacterium]